MTDTSPRKSRLQHCHPRKSRPWQAGQPHDQEHPTPMTHQRNWHPEQVKAEVRLRTGKSLSELSLEHGLPEHALRTCLYRTCYVLAELVIADILDLSPRQIWPSRFRPDGARVHPIRRHSKATTPRFPHNDQLERAA